MINNEVAIIPIIPSATAPSSKLKISRKLPVNMMPAPSSIVLSESFLISKYKDAITVIRIIGNNRWNRISSIVNIKGCVNMHPSGPHVPLPYR